MGGERERERVERRADKICPCSSRGRKERKRERESKVSKLHAYNNKRNWLVRLEKLLINKENLRVMERCIH